MIRSLDILIEEGMNVKVADLTVSVTDEGRSDEKGEDPDSFVRKFGVEALRDRILKAKGLIDYKLDVLMKQFDSRTIEGKAKISGEMILTISKFDNAVMISGYIGRLAKVLMVDKDGNRYDILFSLIVGEHCTYKVKEGKIESYFGKDYPTYINYFGEASDL